MSETIKAVTPEDRAIQTFSTKEKYVAVFSIVTTNQIIHVVGFGVDSFLTTCFK